MESEILPLKWSEDVHSVTAFETLARRLRFQALGRACRRNRIEALLTGHHRDDNVETTIWRLACGAPVSGLAGIPAMARMPECHGMFGVSEVATPRRPGSARESRSKSSTPSLAHTGLVICRPLLEFPKADLEQLCRDNDIPFVSDPTNFDPTLTPRNAVRAMRRSGRLPRALEEPSITSLISSSQSRLRAVTNESNTLLSKCRVLEFSPAVGSLTVEFPPASSYSSLHSDILALTLRRITEVVAPQPENHFPAQAYLFAATNHVFPRENNLPSSSGKGRPPFTAGDVMFRPIEDNPNAWNLSRQPYRRHRQPEINLSEPEPDSWGWKLWDNRFWMRARLRSRFGPGSAPDLDDYELIVRPLQPEDLKPIATQTRENRAGFIAAELKRTLAREAPGLIRFTLPLLVMRRRRRTDEVDNVGGEDTYLALPTLGFNLYVPRRSPYQVDYEWMYKAVDHSVLRMMGLDSYTEEHKRL